MLRYLLLVAVLSTGLLAFGQTTATKPACTYSSTQCQKARTSTPATQQAIPARTVANEPTVTATKPACTYSAAACQKKSTTMAAAQPATPVKATTVAQKDRASIPTLLPALDKNCDPKNCDPKQCIPTNCTPTSSASTTQLAVKQD